MRTWDYNAATIDISTEAGERWYLERLINYGLDEHERIPVDLLRKHIDHINIPEDERGFLRHLLKLHE